MERVDAIPEPTGGATPATVATKVSGGSASRELSKAVSCAEWTCSCHELLRLNVRVDALLGESRRSVSRLDAGGPHGKNKLGSSFSALPTFGPVQPLLPRPLRFSRTIAARCVSGRVSAENESENDNNTSGDAAAASARRYARKLAQQNEDGPVSAIAEAAWRGDPELLIGDSLSALAPGVLERFGGDGPGSVLSQLTFANSHTVDCGDAGLVMIDCGSAIVAGQIFDNLRDVTQQQLHTAIYTHGHVDHIAVNHMDWEAPYRVVAQENVVRRFDRYRKTAGYNTFINKRQFQIPDRYDWQFPGSNEGDLRYPDITYKEYLRFEVGGVVFELFAAQGETDDATIVWLPQQRFCFCGDFFIWNAPNAGNPQKVQRYPEEWAAAARKIIDLRPVIVFPGHGPPLLGEDRVREAFTNQARLLDGIIKHALDGINAGLPLARLMVEAPVPSELVSLPYLRPQYDDPRWFVATLWRRYCGWYSFDIRQLFPVAPSDVGAELARLVGGTTMLARHAEHLVTHGGAEKLGVALEIAELAAAAADTSKDSNAQMTCHQIRARVLRALERRETSLMARSLYRAAALDSEKKTTSPKM